MSSARGKKNIVFDLKCLILIIHMGTNQVAHEYKYI